MKNEFLPINENEIFVEKLGNGWFQLSTIQDNRRYKIKYMGISIKSAKKHFIYNFDKYLS